MATALRSLYDQLVVRPFLILTTIALAGCDEATPKTNVTSVVKPSVAVEPEEIVIEHVPVREEPLTPDVDELAEHLDWRAPIDGVLTSPFGWREVDVDGSATPGFHDAIDVAAAIGTEVVAPVDLRVRTIAYQARAGRHLIADVANDEGAVEWRLTFAHLSHVAVFEGDLIKRGERIGLIGLSGSATGAHLHLRVEAVEGGERIAVDPLPLFPPGTFDGAEALPQPSAIGGGP